MPLSCQWSDAARTHEYMKLLYISVHPPSACKTSACILFIHQHEWLLRIRIPYKLSCDVTKDTALSLVLH